MELFPAIDLYGGKAVRLLHGDYDRMTVYSNQPVNIAEDFAACGAKCIHMVDLEGARSGETPNLQVVSEIVSKCGLFAEVGGGIRSEAVIARYLDAGVSRVILGTAAVSDPDFLSRMVARYGDAIAVSVDLRDGMVATHGWTQKSSLSCDDFMKSLQDKGVSTVICTDISKDGAMQGTNRALYARLSSQFGMKLIASGGVSSLEDIASLRAMDLYGAIIGKAYYTGAIDLRKAVELAR